MIDASWDSALEPFSRDAAAAFILAQTLFVIKESINSGPEGSLSAIKALEQGIEQLYPYTDAHTAAYQLYLFALEGNLLPKHDPTVFVKEIQIKENEERQV